MTTVVWSNGSNKEVIEFHWDCKSILWIYCKTEDCSELLNLRVSGIALKAKNRENMDWILTLFYCHFT